MIERSPIWKQLDSSVEDIEWLIAARRAEGLSTTQTLGKHAATLFDIMAGEVASRREAAAKLLQAPKDAADESAADETEQSRFDKLDKSRRPSRQGEEAG